MVKLNAFLRKVESETHKNLWNFEMRTFPLISTRWRDLGRVNKNEENLPNIGLCRLSEAQSKK